MAKHSKNIANIKVAMQIQTKLGKQGSRTKSQFAWHKHSLGKQSNNFEVKGKLEVAMRIFSAFSQSEFVQLSFRQSDCRHFC